MADKQLNTTPFTIRLRRGLRANIYKPDVHYNHSEIPSGELLYTTDTEQIYYTNSTKVLPLQTVNTIVVFNSEIVFDNEEITVHD